jgi:NitT/TauT family transport system permease protein
MRTDLTCIAWGSPMSTPDITANTVVDEVIPDQRQRSSIKDYLGPVIVFGLFIGAWYLLSLVILPPEKRFMLPTPNKVITEGFLVWKTGESRGLQPILLSLWDSAKVALIGLVITIIVGMALAVLMSSSRWLERATWPYLVAVQSAPVLALTPLIRALIDGAQKQRVLVVVLIAVFPIVSNTLFGLLSAEKSQHELFTLQGASRWTRLTKLQFPAALPNIFVGLRISAGLAVIGAVVGDFYFRQGGVVGIGAQIDVYRNRLWGPELITAIIMASVLGLVVFLFFGWLSRAAIGKWHITNRGQ